MNLADVMDAVGDRLDTIAGLRVFAYPPGSVTPPAAVVSYPEGIEFDATYGRGSDRMTLPVVVVVGKASDRAARDKLGAYCDGSGASSVKAVLESGEYLPPPLNANSRFEIDLTDWGSFNATVARTTDLSFDGVASVRITPTGAATAGLRTNLPNAVPVVAGVPYKISAQVYSVAGWSQVRVEIEWYTAADALLGNSLGTTTDIPAGAWTPLTVTATALANAVKARLVVKMLGTPTPSDLLYADDVELRLTTPAFHTGRVASAEFDVVSIAGTDYLAAVFDLNITGSGS
jgi:hypothetical protein